MNTIKMLLLACVVFGGSVVFADEAPTTPAPSTTPPVVVKTPTPEEQADLAARSAAASSLIQSEKAGEQAAYAAHRGGLTFTAARGEDVGRVVAVASDVDATVLGVIASPFTYGEKRFTALAQYATPDYDKVANERLQSKTEAILVRLGLQEKKKEETKETK